VGVTFNDDSRLEDFMGQVVPINQQVCITDQCRQGRLDCPTPEQCTADPPRDDDEVADEYIHRPTPQLLLPVQVLAIGAVASLALWAALIAVGWLVWRAFQ
jgi:hypothetical protein